MINHYEEINNALLSYENHKPYHIHNTDWICSHIDWSWRWRKITKEQMEELAERVIKVMEGK